MQRETTWNVSDMTEFQLYIAMVIQHLVNMHVVTDLLHLKSDV